MPKITFACEIVLCYSRCSSWKSQWRKVPRFWSLTQSSPLVHSRTTFPLERTVSCLEFHSSVVILNNHFCQVDWRSTFPYLSLVTTPLWWMGLDQPWGLRSEFGLWSKSLSSFIRLSLGRRKWKFWIWTDWCPVWFQLRCGRLLDSRFRTRFGLNILSLQNPERFVWPSAIGQGYLLASAAWILDSAHVLLAQCTFEDVVLKTLFTWSV